MTDGAQEVILALLQPLTPTRQRMFACDCAEHVLPLFEYIFPHDDRPRTAIAAARAYAHGQVTAVVLAEAEARAEDAVWEVSDAASIRNPDDDASLIAWNAAAPAACAAGACCVLDPVIMLTSILSITIEAVVSAHFTTDALEEIWNRAGRPVPPDLLAQYHHHATMERAWQHQRAVFYTEQTTSNHAADPPC